MCHLVHWWGIQGSLSRLLEQEEKSMCHWRWPCLVSRQKDELASTGIKYHDSIAHQSLNQPDLSYSLTTNKGHRYRHLTAAHSTKKDKQGDSHAFDDVWIYPWHQSIIYTLSCPYTAILYLYAVIVSGSMILFECHFIYHGTFNNTFVSPSWSVHTYIFIHSFIFIRHWTFDCACSF